MNVTEIMYTNEHKVIALAFILAVELLGPRQRNWPLFFLASPL